MSSRIPPEIREQVLLLWLQAVSRDEISKKVGIGKGTVSEIVKAYNQDNPEFDLVREFVVTVKKEGSDVKQYASAIRLQRLLESYNLVGEQIEALVRNAANQCFKRKVEIKNFIEDVNKTADIADKTGVALEELTPHIQEMRRELCSLTLDVSLKKEEKKKALQEWNMTQTQLEKFKKHLPRVNEMLEIRGMLENVAHKRDLLVRALAYYAKELSFEKFAHKILAHELNEAHGKLYGDLSQAKSPR